MEFITVKGIVLTEVQYNEADKLVTVFTDKMGVIKASAKGAKSLKRTDLAGLNRFCLGEYILTEGKGMYTVRECSILADFFDIRKDVRALALGCYILECAYMCGCENQPDEELFRLILNTLYAVSKQKNSYMLIKSAYEMKLCQIMGGAPEFIDCPACGEPLNPDKGIAFDFSENCFICSNCKEYAEDAVTVSQPVYMSVKFILTADLKGFISFKIPPSHESKLNELCEKYLLSNLERKPKSLDYLKESFGIKS